MILACAGGVGGARLALGLSEVLPAEALVVAVNTGDDFEHLGMHVSPDLDTVMYTLAGINDPVQGWGIFGETWNFMNALEALGGETWFRLGDRDLATHVERTARLRRRESLSAITTGLCERLSVRQRVVPMSDDPVPTIVHTTEGELAFQEYFVRRRAEPRLMRVEYRGAAKAAIAPGLLAALNHPSLEAIVICPSNPYLSIGPMLALPGMREALMRRRVPAIAVTPIVGGEAVKGPAAKIMRELGEEPSPLTVARFYGALIDALVIDHVDAHLAPSVRALGLRPLEAQTIMRDRDSRTALARAVVQLAGADGERATA